MSPRGMTNDPVLSNDERDELRHLGCLSARVKGLLDRGLITSDSCAAIDADGCRRRGAIERHGRYQAAMGRARAMAKARPEEALSWAERAREPDPAQAEAWSMAVGLPWAPERDEEAVALGAEAAGRFPPLGPKDERNRARLATRTEARRAGEEQARREREMTGRLEEARRPRTTAAMPRGSRSATMDWQRSPAGSMPSRWPLPPRDGSAGSMRPWSTVSPGRSSSHRIPSGRNG